MTVLWLQQWMPHPLEEELAAMSLNNKFKPPRVQQNRQHHNNDKKEACYFCGRPPHPYTHCPACESMCRNSGIKGHWKEVCNSNRQLPIGAMYTSHNQPTLAWLGQQNNINVSYTECLVDGATVQAMINSGSGGTFINNVIAQKLNSFIIPNSRTIPLTDKESFAKIIGEVVINVNIHGHEHRGIVAGVIKDLWLTSSLEETFKRNIVVLSWTSTDREKT